MGVARLLAKIWVLVCLFAGAHAVFALLQNGGDTSVLLPQSVAAVALFTAMGLLFVTGYGASYCGFHKNQAPDGRHRFLAPPSFNDVVLYAFAALSFAVQVWFAPGHVSGPVIEAVEKALTFAVPGHRVLVDRLGQCGLDGGRVFASSFAWLLALIYAASALSRLHHAAKAIHRDRLLWPQRFGPVALAAIIGIVAVVAVQAVFVGSALAIVPCSLIAGLTGNLVIGLAPLVLAYLVVAAMAALLASGK